MAMRSLSDSGVVVLRCRMCFEMPMLS
jgi:hypothetical protein